MQNRYVGDIGDFGKYGLLRALFGSGEASATEERLRLGIVWYLFPDESHNSDGKYTSFLNPTPENHARFRICDPQLYDGLQRLVNGEDRNVAAVRRCGILPCDTAYYETSLAYCPRMPRSARQATRESWIVSALRATAGAQVVFLDPDNGISESDPYLKKGPKYVFIDDIRRFFHRGQSLLIYHHLGRHSTAEQQIRHWAKALQSDLNLPSLPRSLWYHRGTARAYFIVAQECHEVMLENQLESFRRSLWCWHRPGGPHFELVD